MKKLICYALLLISALGLPEACSKEVDMGQLKGLEWVQGSWKGESYDVVTHEEGSPIYLLVTPSYYQLSYDGPITENTSKVYYLLKKEITDGGREQYWIDEQEGICFMNDPESPSIDIEGGNWLYTLSKVDEDSAAGEAGTSFWLSVFPWILKALLAVLALLLILWLVKRIRKWYAESKEKIAAKAQAAKVKAAELGGLAKEKAVELGDKAKEKAIELSEKASEKASEVAKGKKKISLPVWLLILGAYLTLFLDFTLGIVLLLLVAFYFIAKKIWPDKVQKILLSVKDKADALSPVYKHGLVWLVIGLLLYRLFNPFLGVVVIFFSVLFLVLAKFAPAISEKTDVFFEKRIYSPIKNNGGRPGSRLRVLSYC